MSSLALDDDDDDDSATDKSRDGNGWLFYGQMIFFISLRFSVCFGSLRWCIIFIKINDSKITIFHVAVGAGRGGCVHIGE